MLFYSISGLPASRDDGHVDVAAGRVAPFDTLVLRQPSAYAQLTREALIDLVLRQNAVILKYRSQIHIARRTAMLSSAYG
jgi:hypothetical protein